MEYNKDEFVAEIKAMQTTSLKRKYFLLEMKDYHSFTEKEMAFIMQNELLNRANN